MCVCGGGMGGEQPSSVVGASCERLNSVATDMMAKKLNRLSALRAEKIMPLRAWMLFDFELIKKQW